MNDLDDNPFAPPPVVEDTDLSDIEFEMTQRHVGRLRFRIEFDRLVIDRRDKPTLYLSREEADRAIAFVDELRFILRFPDGESIRLEQFNGDYPIMLCRFRAWVKGLTEEETKRNLRRLRYYSSAFVCIVLQFVFLLAAMCVALPQRNQLLAESEGHAAIMFIALPVVGACFLWLLSNFRQRFSLIAAIVFCATIVVLYAEAIPWDAPTFRRSMTLEAIILLPALSAPVFALWYLVVLFLWKPVTVDSRIPGA